MDTGEIRNLARAVADRPRSEETRRQYARDYARLRGEHWHDYAVAHGYAKSSAYKMKAAYQHAIAEHVLECLSEADRARRHGDSRRAADARRLAAALAEELQTADYERNQRLIRESAAAYRTPRRRRGGKRFTVPSLPDGWQINLINAAPKRDRVPLVVLVLTGARPAELEKGIQVERDGESIRMTISGAKTGQGHGQAWRHFRVSGPIAARLAAELRDAGLDRKTITSKGSRDAFRKRLATAAKSADLGPGVSPYTLRHAVASDLKAAGVPVEHAAAVLGHSVTQTQSIYGHAAHGGRGLGHVVDCIQCAQPVRDTTTPHPGESTGAHDTLR